MFAGGLGDDARYARYLQAMHRALVALEHAWQPWHAQAQWRVLIPPPRAVLLQQDLSALDVPAPGPMPIAIDDAPTLLGTLYVIEGSALGARVLRRSRPRADVACHFLDSITADASRWPRLLMQLQALPGDGHDADRAVDGACAVFGHIESTLRELHEVSP